MNLIKNSNYVCLQPSFFFIINFLACLVLQREKCESFFFASAITETSRRVTLPADRFAFGRKTRWTREYSCTLGLRIASIVRYD